MSSSAATTAAKAVTGKVNKEATILEEACRLFASRGFDGTSIRDIANAAGISNAALYHFFADKNALFARIVIDVTQKQFSFTAARVDPAASATEKLRAFMLAYGEFFEEHAFECIAASRTFTELHDSEHRNNALAWRDRYEGLLRDILRQGMAAGEFHDGDVPLIGRAVLSCLNWLHRWYSPAGKLRPVDIIDGYADILLRGIAATPYAGSGA